LSTKGGGKGKTIFHGSGEEGEGREEVFILFCKGDPNDYAYHGGGKLCGDCGGKEALSASVKKKEKSRRTAAVVRKAVDGGREEGKEEERGASEFA